MTFRHTKFEDSQVMRSLEKIAVEKGLVKPAPAKSIHKTASNNLVPSGNFTQDIIKLCAGLRSNGFNKYAEEIESKFLMFKQADTLYQTSKETGEDLIDAAHPEGSHKLDGLDHTVLTIVDRQKRIQEILNKRPTGKLATNKEILNAVKIALAAPPPAGTEPSIPEFDVQIAQYNNQINILDSNIKWLINDAKTLYTKVCELTDPELSVNIDTAGALFEPVSDSSIITSKAINDILRYLSKAYGRLSPTDIWGVGTKDETWIVVKKYMHKITKSVDRASKLFDKKENINNALEAEQEKKDEYAGHFNFQDFTIFKKLLAKTLATGINPKDKASRELFDRLMALKNVTIDDYGVPNMTELGSIIQSRAAEATPAAPAAQVAPPVASAAGAAPAAGVPGPAPAPAEDPLEAEAIKLVKRLIRDITSYTGDIAKDTSPNKSLSNKKPSDYYPQLKNQLIGLSNKEQLTDKWNDTLPNIIIKLKNRITKLNASYGQSLDADDGVFSSKALNAIKALKISLGDAADVADSFLFSNEFDKAVNNFASDKASTDYLGFIVSNNKRYKLYKDNGDYVVNFNAFINYIAKSRSEIIKAIKGIKDLIKTANALFFDDDDAIYALHNEIINTLMSLGSKEDMGILTQQINFFYDKFEETQEGWTKTDDEGQKRAFASFKATVETNIASIEKSVDYYTIHRYNEGEHLSAVLVTSSNPEALLTMQKQEDSTADMKSKIASEKGKITSLLEKMRNSKYESSYTSYIDKYEDYLNKDWADDNKSLQALKNFYTKINRNFEAFNKPQ